MKRIPRKITIGGVTYSIEQKSGLKVEGDDSMGCVLVHTHTIRLNKELNQDMKVKTLIHEILECIKFEHNLDLDHSLIESLEVGLFEALRSINWI